MSLPLFTRLGLGIGLGLSAATATATLHPLSPLRTPALQCQYSAPYYRPEGPASAEAGWAVKPNDPLLSKQGRTGLGGAAEGFLTPGNMKQVSLGSVLGLVAGVGLRAFSRVLVVIVGMGVVLVEVCSCSCSCGPSRFEVKWLLMLGCLLTLIVGCVQGV